MDMTQGPIFSKIIVFALPLIFTNLLQMLYNAADMVVVGKFSGVDGAVGAIGSTGALLNLATNIIIGFSTGANVCVANALGSKDEARTRKAVHSSIFLGIIFGLVGLVIGLTVTKPLLIWMKADPALLDMSVKYCQIVFLGVPFSTVLNYAISILNAKGDTTTPLMILSSSGLLNVILNIAFVKGLGLNVEGVAIATVIANIFSLAAVLIKLTRETGWCQLSFKKYRPDKDTALSIIKIGLPSGIQGTLLFPFQCFHTAGGQRLWRRRCHRQCDRRKFRGVCLYGNQQHLPCIAGVYRSEHGRRQVQAAAKNYSQQLSDHLFGGPRGLFFPLSFPRTARPFIHE